MLKVLSTIAYGLTAALIFILFLPLILVILLIFGTSTLLKFIFRKIRQDPTVKLEPLIEAPDYDEQPNEEVLKNAQAYFADLSAVIAREGHAAADKLRTVKEEDGEHEKLILKRTITSEYATIELDLIVDIDRSFGPDATYSSWEDGDDLALAGYVNAAIELTSLSEAGLVRTVIHYDQEAAHFCIAILNGTGMFNQSTGQMWARLADRDVWMVGISRSYATNFGYRRKYGLGKARTYWVDGK